MLATAAALVVGKAVLVANAMPLLRRYDRGPLIQPILFKTLVYWAVVFIARLLERFVHFSLIDTTPPELPAAHGRDLFLASLCRDPDFDPGSVPDLCDGTELNHLFGHGELRRILFTHRPSTLQLNRRQRIRELVRLSRLADAHTVDEFRDPNSVAHQELVDIVQRLAR